MRTYTPPTDYGAARNSIEALYRGLIYNFTSIGMECNPSLTDYDFVPPKMKPLKNPTERDRLIEYYLSLDTVYGYACALMECLNLRISEIKALKWSDIFMDDGYPKGNTDT